jgi:hypothetical protein
MALVVALAVASVAASVVASVVACEDGDLMDTLGGRY